MLFTSTRPLWRLAMNLLQTFVLPWGPLPLAVVVLTLAAIGIVVLLRRDRRGLVLLAGRGGALRDLPPGLAGERDDALCAADRAVDRAPGGDRACAGSGGPARDVGDARPRGSARAGPLGGRGRSRSCAGLPALTAYTREPAPVFRLFADMRHAGRAARTSSWRCTGAATPTRGGSGAGSGAAGFPWRLLDAPAGHEWLELVRYWREGGAAAGPGSLPTCAAPTWRSIDPASRHANGHYDWSTPFAAGVLGGTRPGALDWVVIDGPPAWFLGQGWALSPEIAGVRMSTARARRSVARWAGCGGARCRGAWSSAGATSVARARRSSASRCASAIASSTPGTWPANPGFFVRSTTLPGSAVARRRFRTGAASS